MKIRLLFILTLISVTALSALAQQRRTVTNDNLDKYRQKRVAAERDLRENYERLGFPSPEVLQKQIEQSRVERSELAARLRAEDLEREQLDLERQRAANEARNRDHQYQNQNYSGYADDYFYNYSSGGFYSFPNFGFPNNRFNRFNRGGFGNRHRRGFGNQPRIEYRNNLPVIIPPSPRRILAPGGTRNRGGRRN
jgi:hypothetical protein